MCALGHVILKCIYYRLLLMYGQVTVTRPGMLYTAFISSHFTRPFSSPSVLEAVGLLPLIKSFVVTFFVPLFTRFLSPHCVFGGITCNKHGGIEYEYFGGPV